MQNNNLEFVGKVELDDDTVARLVMNHYFGRTFPVMLTYYHDGKYSFEGYTPKINMVDVTPGAEKIDIVT